MKYTKNTYMAQQVNCSRMRLKSGRRSMRRFVCDEQGDTTMLEAAIVYPITLCLLVVVLSVYTMLYQRWNLQTIAVDAAARVGSVFKFYGSKMAVDWVTEDISGNYLQTLNTGEVNYDDMNSMDPYRYYDNYSTGYEGETDMKFNSEVLARNYIMKRLQNTTTAIELGTPTVTVEPVSDGIARYHFRVTITATYRMIASSALTFVGLPGDITFTVTANSICLDLSDYLVTSGYVGTMSDRLSHLGLSSQELRSLGKQAITIRELLKSNIDRSEEE